MEDTKEYINTLFERFKEITNRSKEGLQENHNKGVIICNYQTNFG